MIDGTWRKGNCGRGVAGDMSRSCEFCVKRRRPSICFIRRGRRKGRLEDSIRDSGSREVSMVITTMRTIIALKVEVE